MQSEERKKAETAPLSQLFGISRFESFESDSTYAQLGPQIVVQSPGGGRQVQVHLALVQNLLRGGHDLVDLLRQLLAGLLLISAEKACDRCCCANAHNAVIAF